MELIDDWGNKERAALPPGQKAPATHGASLAEAIGAALETLDPDIINVHCYEDLGHPWVQVVFKRLIHPKVALAVGDALAAVPGAGSVYLNSLRPKAVYCLLEPAFSPQPTLPASRYGAGLGEIRKAWKQA